MSEEVKTEEVKTEEVKTEEVKEEAKYTDKQLNDLIAKNSAKEIDKFIKANGLKSSEEIKELLELKNSKMTEDQKKDARIKELEDGSKAEATRAEKAEAKAEALSNGVKADKVDRLVKLAMSGDYEGDTVSEKIANALKDFPEFIGEPTGEAFGKKGNNDKLNASDELLNKMRKDAGLTK